MGVIDNFKKSEKDLQHENKKKQFSFVYSCDSFTSLDASNFDTSDVTNISSMFDNCNLNNCYPFISLESLETKGQTYTKQ